MIYIMCDETLCPYNRKCIIENLIDVLIFSILDIIGGETMARSIAKRKYKKIRKDFKKEIKPLLENNKALCMAILNTYIADKHRTHIHKMWHLFGTQYKDAWRGYCESGLVGKMLCGDENIYNTLYFSGYEEIANKYRRILPMKIAFGEIHMIIINTINDKTNNK